MPPCNQPLLPPVKKVCHYSISSQKRSAFTVLELLVVVSVVAVLVILGLSASLGLREQGAVAGCLSKLKAFGVAFHHYANDHNDYLSTGEPRGWEVRLTGYLPDDFLQLSKLSHSDRKRTVFICPAEKEPSTRNYGINYEFRVDAFGEAAVIRRSEIRFPGQYCLLADGYAYGYINHYTTAKLVEMSHLTRRHKGRPNFLYADGHVAPFTEELKGTSDSNKNPFYQRLWRARYHGN